MKLVTRGQWGARAPKTITRIPGPVTSVTDHWEGPSMGSFAHDRCADLVRGIQRYHMDHNGWADIAYSAVVCPHGWVFEGRWLGVRSAANGTNPGNASSYAVCGLRGAGDPFTDEMKVAFWEVHDFFMSNGAAGRAVYPHKKWLATSCPGPEQSAWIAAGCPVTVPKPVVVADPVPTDKAVAVHAFEEGGYWVFAEDGGVFAVDAPFHGSLGNVRLNAPVAAAVPLLDKSGYWMVGRDGGIFAFGAARPIAPYQALFGEYARGERRITGAQRFKDGLLLVSNLGDLYHLT